MLTFAHVLVVVILGCPYKSLLYFGKYPLRDNQHCVADLFAKILTLVRQTRLGRLRTHWTRHVQTPTC